jgi:predicted MFS family arabinose efflux permease
MAIAACYVYVLTFFQSWFQTYLVKGRGYAEVDLMLSSLPYVVGACGNLTGGFSSDWLCRSFGLKTGRRAVGVAGLGVAALSMVAVILTANNTLALVFLSLVYGGLTFQQPNIAAVCLDIGGPHSGAILGFMNTAANAAGACSSVIFGYLVGHFASYTAPLIPMVVVLVVGAVLWLTVDPSREIFVAPAPAAL